MTAIREVQTITSADEPVPSPSIDDAGAVTPLGRPACTPPSAQSDGPLAVLRVFLRLGCTSFGGPVAHLGYFRSEFVGRLGWLAEAEFADLVALCQFLPGPASSQVAVSLGRRRAGLAGGLAAWAGFTAPSALAMILFAEGAGALGGAGVLHGLKLVAVAVVAQAIFAMARNLCPDPPRASLAVAATALVLAVPSAAGQLTAIGAGAIAGLWLPAPPPATGPSGQTATTGRGPAIAALASFALLLGLLPLLAAASGWHAAALFDRFYRAGALVFGGGHVVLPLLHDAVVPSGWIGDGPFLAGYGLAQAVPGPLFSFAAYLGAAMSPAPNGWLGGVLCLVAIYLPSFLLLLGVLPFWDVLRAIPAVRRALRGVNAAVVGLLLAAFYAPVWTGSVTGPADFARVLAALLLLAAWRWPPWLVVALGAISGTLG